MIRESEECLNQSHGNSVANASHLQHVYVYMHHATMTMQIRRGVIPESLTKYRFKFLKKGSSRNPPLVSVALGNIASSTNTIGGMRAIVVAA